MALSESRRRTAARFERWNALKRRDRYGRMKRRAFGGTPLGAEVLRELIGSLADFLAGKLDDKPFPPPDELNRRFGQLSGDPFPATLWQSSRRSSTTSRAAGKTRMTRCPRPGWRKEWADTFVTGLTLRSDAARRPKLIGGYSSK